jgi:hypothetical protein
VPQDPYTSDPAKGGFASPAFARTFQAAVLLLVLLGTGTFFLRHFDFVSMWVEGLAEIGGSLLIMAGAVEAQPDCWLRLGSAQVPLAQTGYIGPGYVYAYFPSAAAWVAGVSSNPYIYRFTGFGFYCASVLLLHLLLRLHYGWKLALAAAAFFATTPLLVLTLITEQQSVFIPIAAIFTALLLLSRYWLGASAWWLVAAGFFLGVLLLLRIEALIWLGIPMALFILQRPRDVAVRWRQERRPLLAVFGAMLAFVAAASPMIAYNLSCPHPGLLSVIRTKVIPNSLGGGPPLIARLGTRIEQFVDHVVLGIWPANEVFVRNYPAAVFFVSAVLILLIHGWRKRRIALPLLVILSVLPLSVLVTGPLRVEHLTVMYPIVAISLAAAGSLAADPKRRLIAAAISLACLSNVLLTGAAWRQWSKQPDTATSYLNNSDPLLLVQHLDMHGDAAVIFTNIGLAQYAFWASKGRTEGVDLTWLSDEEFRQRVLVALLQRNRERLFVALSPDQDGRAGALPRTSILYQTLDAAGVRYQVRRISSERNHELYDFVIVPSGIGIEGAVAAAIKLATDSDVRIVKDFRGEGPHIVGSLHGEGFASGDLLLVNRSHTYYPAVADPTWLTFAIPRRQVGAPSFTVQLVRPSTLAVSDEHDIWLGGPPSPSRQNLARGSLTLSRVADVRRIENFGGAGAHVVGSAHGSGFAAGDLVSIDGENSYPATVANDGWLTFAVPARAIENPEDFRFRVTRPGMAVMSEERRVVRGFSVAPETVLELSEALAVTRIADVRLLADFAGRGAHLVGSVHGSGFAPGNVVRIDDRRDYPATVGNSGWLTFAIPAADLGGAGKFTLRVVSKNTSSQQFVVTVPELLRN